MSHRGAVLAAVVTAVSAAPAGQAAQPGYEVTVGVGEADNVFLAPSNRTSDTIFLQGVEFSWHDKQSRLTADVDADLNYLEFVNHSFNNQLVGNFLGGARFALVPDLLYWDLGDNFGQGRVNPFEQITPANQENINYASTGPELILPLGGSETLLDVQARYGRVSYQVSPLDSTRTSGQVGLLRMLSANSNVSINVRDEHVVYSNDVVNQDYSRQDAFLRFDAKGVRTTVDIEVGASKLRDPVAPSTGVMASVEASRKISPSSTLAASYSHQYSDAANSFVLGQTLSGAYQVTPQTVTQQGAPFKSDMGNLAWNFQKERTGLGLGVTYYKDVYQPALATQRVFSSNDNRTELDGHVSRQLTPTLQVTLFDHFTRENFTGTLGSFTENEADLRLAWRPARRITVTFDYSHDTRTSNLPGTNYVDNRLWFTIGYGRQAQLPPGPVTPPLPSAARLY
jgi:hypothetical protein